MAFNQKFAPHIATRNGESVETTYFKYRGGHIKSSEKGRGLESHGQDEETVKNKVESREEDGGAVQSQSRTRVWNCIFRIHDLTKRYGIRKKRKISWRETVFDCYPDSPKFGHAMQDFLPVCRRMQINQKGVLWFLPSKQTISWPRLSINQQTSGQKTRLFQPDACQ